MIPRLAPIVVCVLFSGLAAGQDVIRLKNGADLEGEVVLETPTHVTLQFKGGSVQVERTRILAVDRGVKPIADDTLSPGTFADLTRFQDSEDSYFLYREGRRVGFRVVSMKKVKEAGISGYELTDRLVFLDSQRATELEVRNEEFVDADLRPIKARALIVSAGSIREVVGEREGDLFRIEQKYGGQVRRTVRLSAKNLELPGFWLRRRGQGAKPGGEETERVLDLLGLDIVSCRATGRSEQVTLWGDTRNVRVIDRGTTRGAEQLGSWVDSSGVTLREEIGSPSLVALRAPAVEVAAYARGEQSTEKSDLGLEFVSPMAGLHVQRPDLTWEVEPGKRSEARLVSLLKSTLGATVDVFHLGEFEGVSLEGIATRTIAQMEAKSQGLSAGPVAQTLVAERPAVEFSCAAKRSEKALRSHGLVFKDGESAYFVVCAAPEESYQEARTAFSRILNSLRFSTAKDEEISPLKEAEARLRAGQ